MLNVAETKSELLGKLTISNKHNVFNMLRIRGLYIILFFIALSISTVLLFGCGGGGGGEEGSGTSHSPINNVSQEGQITANGVTIRFTAPSLWSISHAENSDAGLYSPTSASLVSGGDLTTPPDIMVSLLTNNSGLSLANFVNSYDDGWFAVYKENTTTTINGYPAIITDDTGAAISHVPGLAAFVSKDNMIVFVAGNQDARQEFYNTLNSIRP